MIVVLRLVAGMLTNLDFVSFSTRLHSAGHVHGISPNVVMRLPRSDNTGDHGTNVDSDPDLRGTCLVDAMSSSCKLTLFCTDFVLYVRASPIPFTG